MAGGRSKPATELTAKMPGARVRGGVAPVESAGR